MMNKSIDDIRIENEKLYNEYVLKCEDLQPLISKIYKEFEDEITINKLTKEEYGEMINEMANKRNISVSEFLEYDLYLEHTEYLYKRLMTINSNLSCYKIELKERYDHNNKNKVLSYYYELQFVNDYINEICNDYEELFSEYK